LLPIAISVMGGACERRSPGSGEIRSPVLARVNGEELTRRDFNRFLPEDYESTLTAEEVRDYLDRWVNTQILYEKALESGVRMSADIEARLEQYKKDLVAEQFVQKVIEERAVVSRAEVQRFYEAHRGEYEKEYRVSHILVNTPEDAEKVHSLLGSRSFEYLAEQYSVDKHSNVGGDLGYLSRGSMIPEFEEVIYGMKVGDVSDVIASEFGYHIIKVTDIRDTQTAFENADIAEEITNLLTLEKRQAVYDSLVASLRSRAKVEFTDEIARLGATAEPDTTRDAQQRDGVR
jgi:peptidyl-prolyl cis-trans isomerase C